MKKLSVLVLWIMFSAITKEKLVPALEKAL
jgi:hypothetical protein